MAGIEAGVKLKRHQRSSGWPPVASADMFYPLHAWPGMVCAVNSKKSFSTVPQTTGQRETTKPTILASNLIF